MFAVILDTILILLLILAMIFCQKLNKKIAEIKKSKEEMQQLAKILNDAVTNTNQNISDLKIMSSKSVVELTSYINKAQNLINDLSFMTETAGQVTDRLEKEIGNLQQARQVLMNDQSEIDVLMSNIPDNDDNAYKTSDAIFSKTRQELINAVKLARGNAS